MKIHRSLPKLEKLLDDPQVACASDDGFYRFYHQSFKVFGVQTATLRIVEALQALAPDRKLNPCALVEVGAKSARLVRR